MRIICKIFTLSSLLILMSCTSEKSSPSIKGQKIAYVDPEQIIPSMPEYIKAKEEFESLKSKMQSELEAEQGKAQSYEQSSTRFHVSCPTKTRGREIDENAGNFAEKSHANGGANGSKGTRNDQAYV
jgi:hypothetical protein